MLHAIIFLMRIDFFCCYYQNYGAQVFPWSS